MKAPSLERRFSTWFAITLWTLYSAVAIGVWGSARQNGRQTAILNLKAEAEAIAFHIATTGIFDVPELEELEREPFPVWIRVLRGNRIVAATPGAPELPFAEPDSTLEVLYLRSAGAATPHLVVRHAVGGAIAEREGWSAVEAIGDISPVRALERRLGIGLTLLGLVVIPFATWGGRRLARRALAPLATLVQEIQELAPDRLESRLSSPLTAVSEVGVLASNFNELLRRLERSLAAMRRFTADASHEIRNPLSVMRTGLEVALRRDRTEAQYRALLRENLEEIDRLQATLEGLLALARTEPGRAIALQRGPVDLSALLREAVQRFAIAATERGVTLEVAIDHHLTTLGDARLLRLVPFNLLDNALKHGPPGASIRFEAERQLDWLTLRVSDQGPGIPPAARSRIFERYLQLDADDGESGVGGLGLSVVRWVAEAHDGSVELVDSARGTCFEVKIPAAGGEA